jgi:hypothetical protein
MHPAIHCHLVQARTAGLHHQVPRNALSRVARPARCARRHQPGHPVPGLAAVAARCVATGPGARNPRPVS